MRIFVPKETVSDETRVAMSPDVAKRLIGHGLSVTLEKGAGELARIPDEKFEEVGAQVGTAKELGKADIVFSVRRPDIDQFKAMKKGAVSLSMMDPYGADKEIAAIAKSGVSSFSMEFMPRITRAQVMDVLSSQANLAGYQGVVEASAAFDRALPMMMTAAGTVPAAKLFVMGAGVAGLQAIATGRRLGAIVTATDVRAAAGEQVESLGAKFIMHDALKDASGEGGYARELTDEEKAAQAELVAGHIAKQDIVITTALIPGRPAPKLISKEMVASMAPGSVIVDLAVERGGNVEGSVASEIVTTQNGVTIVGRTNLAGRIASTASVLYAKNLLAFFETLISKNQDGEVSLNIDAEDELVQATLITHEGSVVHPNFADGK